MIHEAYSFETAGREYDDMIREALDEFYDKHNVNATIHGESWTDDMKTFNITLKG